MRTGRFEVYRGGGTIAGTGARWLWYWRLRAANGLIVADGSEGYATRSNAFRAARRAVDIALRAEHSLFPSEGEA